MNNSKRRAITVVKRNELKSAPSAIRPVTDHSISVAVDNWILKRNQSRDAEKVFSNANIAKWKLRPTL